MRSLLFPMLAAFAAPAAAQPNVAPEPVAFRGFVEDITVLTQGQVARFYEPVCVVSEGLPPDFNAVVEARVGELARAAGIAVSERSGCAPNLIVLVADDSSDVAAALRRRRPEIFEGLDAAEISRVVASDGPVRSWQRTEASWANGEPILDRRNEYLGRDVHLFHGVPAGFLRTSTRQALRLSVVVFDVEAIDGLTLMQIADHAAMLGLAPTRTGGAAAGHSILSLFHAAAAERAELPAVTRWDLAYLRALYRIGAALDGNAHRSLLSRLAAQDLASRR